MYEGKVFKGVRLDGKKGRFTVKVTMQDKSIENLEFNSKADAVEARMRVEEAGCHARLVEN